MGKNNLLPHGTVHLGPERLIGDDNIDAPLIGQGSTRYGFFVERRDHSTIDGFGD